MASFDQKLRTLYLMEILLERTDDEHMLNASELCTILDQEYGISTDRRTIYTEMEVLDKFGLDIQQKKGKCPGYYIGARDFELPELKLLRMQCSLPSLLRRKIQGINSEVREALL